MAGTPGTEAAGPLTEFYKISTTLGSPLTRIGTCLRLVEGTGVHVPDPIPFSITVCIHGLTEIFLLP